MDEAKAATIEIVVKLEPTSTTGTAGQRAVMVRAEDLGVVLVPVAPDAPETELGSYYTALVDADIVDRVVEQLRPCAGVESVYAKSPGEPP